ncbi:MULTISPECIES: peptidylprolyl isomerase [unclassified Enterococcus]|jgi:foldase protein PrsA|uniref:peptidylprolyl isomerase n=1 Tax=unclassified Enterococcus TaxID=2608891 RepID=UPI000353D21B|nr:putative foldase protein PrsA [Enterococcus faecalis 13-SD-W-01]
MKKKKFILAAASALAVFTLAACSSGNNEEIATMKGGKITVADFYEEAKKESANQTLVQNMIIYKVFDNKYGDEVSKEDVDKRYEEQAEQYGDTFESQLEAAGFTVDSFKESIRQNLVVEAGIKDHIDLTDEDMKSAWESFHPEVEAQIIRLDSEDDAKDVKKQADDGKDFAELAKDKSTDDATKEDGGTIKFDSRSTEVPDEVKEAAFKLKNDEISDVITTTNMTTYAQEFYVVKMVKTQAKGNDMDKFKDEVTEVATEAKRNDQAFVTEVIGKELKDANVKIKDDAFENVLSNFMTSTSSTTATTDTNATTDTTEETDSSN